MPFRNSICWAVLLLLILTACHRTEVEIPFETIENNQYGGYAVEKPSIEIITSPEEVDELKDLISSEAVEALRKIDYSRDIGLILFHGIRAVGPFSIEVNEVSYDGQGMYINSTFTEPGEIRTMLVTSPYHLIKIERPARIESNLWTTFVLYDEGQEVARRRVAIPEMDGPSSVTSPLSPLESTGEE